MKDKIDVIIKIDSNASVLKMSIYSIMKNTPKNIINKIYLIGNCSDSFLLNCINNLKNKYGNIVYKNSIDYNSVIEKSACKYIVIMSSNMIISKNALVKMKSHLKKDNIDIAVPISNEYFDIPDNYTYCQVNDLCETQCSDNYIIINEFEHNFVIFNRDKISNYINFLSNEFFCLKENVSVHCYIDTYVFNNNTNKKNSLNFNKVSNYILSKVDFSNSIPNFDFVIYLISLVQDSGGIHVAVDIINYLLINGYNCNILYNNFYKYDELMLFKPVHLDSLKKCKINSIVSTIYFSTFYAREIADFYNIPLIYFAQGYEPFFNNATEYATAELSYKIPDDVLCVSSYLQKCYKLNFNVDSTCITNGINLDLLYHDQKEKKDIKTISICLRGSDLKGDFILMDVIKKISNSFCNIELNIICNNPNIELPLNNNKSIIINRINGPLKRDEIADLLQHTDIYIDGSLTEGFGLMSLEAMAAGAVVIASNSGGNLEYLKNNYNGLIVNKVNQPEEYILLIKKLLADNKLYNKYRINSMNSVKKYDFDDVVDKYIDYFSKSKKKKNVELTDIEKIIYNNVLEKKFKYSKSNSSRRKMFKIRKFIPKKIRNVIKKIVNKLYSIVNYE